MAHFTDAQEMLAAKIIAVGIEMRKAQKEFFKISVIKNKTPEQYLEKKHWLAESIRLETEYDGLMVRANEEGLV